MEARPDALDASFRGRDGPTNMASAAYLSRDREMLHVMCDFNIHIYIYILLHLHDQMNSVLWSCAR